MVDELSVGRPALLFLVLLSVAACDGAADAPLVSRDTVGGSAEPGCVAPEQRAAGQPVRWRVRSGDSLRKIAKRVYGDEELWQEIRDANPDKVGEGARIQIGDELLIPFDGQ